MIRNTNKKIVYTFKVYDVERNAAVRLKSILETNICDFCCDFPDFCDRDVISECGCKDFDHREVFIEEESEL